MQQKVERIKLKPKTERVRLTPKPETKDLDKVGKILALASSSNQHERGSAIERANELLARHGLVVELKAKGSKALVPYKPRDNGRRIFTDLGLRKIKAPPQGKQVTVADEVQRGLYLLVSSGGTRTFFVKCKIKGKWVSISLGRLGENTSENDGENFSIIAAREKARAYRALAAEGKDPREIEATKEAEQEADAFTVKDGIDLFIADLKERDLRSWDQVEYYLNKYWAHLHKLSAKSITRQQVREHVEAIKKSGKTPTDMQRTAEACLGHIKHLWKFLASNDKLEFDILAPLVMTFNTRRRERFYSDKEIRATWRAAAKLAPDDRDFMHLTILLAPRGTSLALLKWSHLDKELDVWTTPPELCKQRNKKKGMRVYKTPLSEPAKAILAKRKRGKDDERVFPSLPIRYTKANRPSFEAGSLKNRLKARGAPKDVAMHAWRHTIGTWHENNGKDESDTSLILNHASTSVTSGYRHGVAIARKRELLAEWAEHVLKIVS